MTTQTELFVEERLFIGGQLRDATGGRTYQNINPATEEVIGVAADATADDMSAAIAAARTAFDEGEWADRPKLSRPVSSSAARSATAACSRSCGPRFALRSGPPKPASKRHSSTARWTISRYAADLCDRYEFVQDLGTGESMGMMSRRLAAPRAGRCRRLYHAVERADAGQSREGRLRPGSGLHRCPEAGARHSLERERARTARPRRDRHARRGLQRGGDLRQRGGAVACRGPAGRSDQLHRLDRRGTPPDGARVADDQARLPRTRRQVRLDRLR